MCNFNFLSQAVSEILSSEKRLGRAGSGRVGPGRVGPCHIKNGFYMKKEEFWYQSDLSTMIFEGFRSCLFSPYTCRISSLRSQLSINSSSLLLTLYHIYQVYLQTYYNYSIEYMKRHLLTEIFSEKYSEITGG